MSTNLREQVNKLPDESGVYFFKRGKDILYIGKATSLRDRVRSYFTSDLVVTRSLLIQNMVEEADTIDFEVTDSVLEALILEANLIKQFKPLYNTREKDDKSYNYVVFTDEEYPRVFTVRGQELQTEFDPDEFKYVYGPFTSGTSLRKAMKLIRRIFPYRGEKDPVERTKRQSPLNEQIGLVPDFEETSKREYQRLIRNLSLFFQGKKRQLMKDLERQMKEAARDLRFEEAERIKGTMFALEHIQDTALIAEDLFKKDRLTGFRVEAYDIAHIGGKDMVGVMVVIEDGRPKKSGYRKFKINTVKSRSDDTKALTEILERRLTHNEWPLPKIIVVDGGKGQYNAFKKVLTIYGIEIPLVAVTKGEGHQPKGYIGDTDLIHAHEQEILLANAESHRFAQSYHKNLRRKRMR